MLTPPQNLRATAWAAFVLLGFLGVSYLTLLVVGPVRESLEDAEMETANFSTPVEPQRETPLSALDATAQASPSQTTTATNAPAALPLKHQPNALSFDAPRDATINENTSRPAPLATQQETMVSTAPEPKVFVGSTEPTSAQSAPLASPEAAAKPAAPRAVNASALVRGLSGHNVHAAISGDAQTKTLVVSGPSLTRELGLQWLGGARGELKSAGIRVVVIMSEQGSWTFML